MKRVSARSNVAVVVVSCNAGRPGELIRLAVEARLFSRKIGFRLPTTSSVPRKLSLLPMVDVVV